MLIDHHIHFTNEEDILKIIERYKIDKAIIFAKRLDEKSVNLYKKENQKVLDFAKKNKKIIPFMHIHPFLDDLEYVKKNFKQFKGFKLNCNPKITGYSYTDLKKSKVFEFVLRTKKPIIFHTGYKKGHRIKDILPNLKKGKNGIIIFAHAGRFIGEDLKVSSKYENIFIDVCPLNVISENSKFISSRSPLKKDILNKDFSKVINFLKKYFEGRIIWGSDFPSCNELSKEGYSGELKIYKELVRLGENNTFLKN
ncbi:MAG: hypothetical protein WC511_00065 [Candidatus Pacearchaeota archaeon]|jgi:predicted TIM-barrel fold metal-dependent hydrolase